MQAFCPSCRDEVELEVVSLDSGAACPRCGRANLETAPPPGVLDRDDFSHRLRTPLTVVKGSLQHLVKHWDDLSDRDRKVLVRAVLAQTDVAIDEIAAFEDQLSAGTVRESVEPERR